MMVHLLSVLAAVMKGRYIAFVLWGGWVEVVKGDARAKAWGIWGHNGTP
jgi:hypothetical protein